MIPLETISIISTKYDAHHIIMANYVISISLWFEWTYNEHIWSLKGCFCKQDTMKKKCTYCVLTPKIVYLYKNLGID